MKKKIGIIVGIALTVVMVMALVPGMALAGKDVTGNGCPSGAHYNLNIIGMANPKNASFDGGNGHRIFVDLGSKNVAKTTRIYLFEGDFAVLDANGTDGRAEFQLPNPDPQNDGVTEYSVFLRVLGKPGGKIKMATCATDPHTGEEVCSDLQVIKVRETGKGKQKFENVSAELLYIYAWVWDPVDELWEYMRLPLFSDPLQDYLWKYDNSGVRIAQLRFYPGVQTTVPDPGEVAQLTSIVPNSGVQGWNGAVVITGANIDFAAEEVSSVDFGNKIGVTMGTVTATQVTVNIAIAGDAKTGWRYVEVKLDDGRTLSIPFEVTAGP